MDLVTATKICDRGLAESALAAPAAGFGDHEEYPLPYTAGTIQVGELLIRDVHGYNPAGVYVRRISGTTDGISVAEIIISVVGDGYAQEELDAENDEAERYPLGPKEFWRSRLVGKAAYGTDSHPMTDSEFEADWDESQSQ